MVWRAHYDEVTSDGGMVTAPDQRVADAGAHALREGGNAVDAAVAASFADGVVQPYMAGTGGSTLMTIALRGPDRFLTVDGGMVAPMAATPEQYPLAQQEPPGGWPVSFYDWPAVVGAANALGPRSVAVPGSVAALCVASERYGRLPLRAVLAPAIRLAADGIDVNWFFGSMLAAEAHSLARDEGCAEVFLRKGGLPRRGPGVRTPDRVVQSKLAETLDRLADEGSDLFYAGDVARSIVDCVRTKGGLLSLEDLAGFRPTISDAAAVPWRDHVVVGPAGTGFPSVIQLLRLLDAGEEADSSSPDVVRWARACWLAMEDRFHHGSADPARPALWDVLMSTEYAAHRLQSALLGQRPPDPWLSTDRRAAATSGPAGGGCTSQLTAIDAAGNMVSVTQTVLNTFGSRVLDPGTGVLLNDGIGYYDTRPGSVNGIAPGRPALSAMSPVVLCDGNGPMAVFGASGGRRIISGVAQLVAALARGSSMQAACEEPRFHAESSTALLDVRWPEGAADALRGAGFTVELTEEGPTTVHFARPNGVLVARDGTRRSGLDPNKPAGVAVA